MDFPITPANINPPCNSCGVHHTGGCKLYKKASPEDDILWSDSSYTLPEMSDRFGSRLPYLARVGLGDFGETEASTIEIGQVLRVAMHYDQPRVIGTTANGNVISIPLSFPLKFDAMRLKSTNMSRFTESVRAFSKGKRLTEYTKKLPITVVLCENDYSDDVIRKASYSYEDVRQLTLTKVHKYSYLVCNEVTGGVINTYRTLLLPTFMRMKLNISTEGLRSNSRFSIEQLQQLQDSLTESASQINYDEILEPQGIFHYEGNYNQNLQYERLQPTEYVQHMYTRARHPLVALVSFHATKLKVKVKKALESSSRAPEDFELRDEEGIYERIELKREGVFKKSKRKPSPPPKRQLSAYAQATENPYAVEDYGAVNPDAMSRQVNNSAGPPHNFQKELAARLQLQTNSTYEHTN